MMLLMFGIFFARYRMYQYVATRSHREKTEQRVLVVVVLLLRTSIWSILMAYEGWLFYGVVGNSNIENIQKSDKTNKKNRFSKKSRENHDNEDDDELLFGSHARSYWSFLLYRSLKSYHLQKKTFLPRPLKIPSRYGWTFQRWLFEQENNWIYTYTHGIKSKKFQVQKIVFRKLFF